jgi:hypothetical protein
VITLQAALLANAASLETSGLISMLGGFVDAVAAPQLPIRHQIWLIARLIAEQDDMSEPHALVVTVDHSDGTEQLARVEATTNAQAQMEGIDPDLPIGMPVVMPLFLEFRRLGLYHVRLVLDGELVWEGPFKVRTLLPQL